MSNINWSEDNLKSLLSFYEEELKDSEEEMENDPDYPPDVQSKIDTNQRIVWLIGDMMNEKSWIFRKCQQK